MRILHAPVNSSGQAFLISRAQRRLGFKSDVIVFYQNFLGYQNDKNLKIDQKPLVIRELVMLWTFLNCLFRYDVFHFHCGLTLLPYHLDLPILKLFNKKIIMEYWGSDMIQIDMASQYTLWTAQELREIYPNVNDEKQRKKINEMIKKVNQIVIGSAAHLIYAPGTKIIEKAIDLENFPFTGPKNKDKPVIVHAPTNRKIKGTSDVLETVEILKKEGLKFEFKLVEGRRHSEALKDLKNADIVIDQLRAGPFGTLGVESMALGKPVICWRHKALEHYYPDCPVVNASKKTLYKVLKKLIINSNLREELGIKSRKYVEKYHDSRIIAQQFIDLYNSISYKKENFAIRPLDENDLPYVDNPSYYINYPSPVDAEGIVISKYQCKVYYNPVTIIEKTIYFLNKKMLKEAEKFAQKLIDISQDFNGAIFFPYNFDFYLHGIKKEKMAAPWYSGMAQGQALTVFTRLYKITKNQKYLTIAQRIFQSFKCFYDSSDPWICYLENKYLWIEEYPMEKPGHTLNGFIYALFGLYEYWLLADDSDCRDILLGGLTTIKENISKFRQAGGISLYCLKHRRKSVHYHEVHTSQLKKLYQITGDMYFKEMAEKLYKDYH